MHRLILLFCILFASLGSLAGDVAAVSAQDLTAKTARVSISLSEASSYRVQRLPGGNGIRVVVSQSTSVQAVPSFNKSSKVIDNIIAYNDGDFAYIDVRTKGNLPVDHMISPGLDLISLAINYHFGRETRKAAVVPATPKTLAPVKPAPRKTVVAKPAPVQTVDTLSTRARTPLADTRKSIATATTQTSSWKTRLKPYITHLIVAWALLSSLVVILLFFRRKKPIYVHEDKLEAPVYKAPRPESQTLVRMVQKLLEQGWTASEVERELKLDPGEVENMAAYLKSADYEG